MTLSRRLVLFFALTACASPAAAQQAYGPTDFGSEAIDDEDVPLIEAAPCEETVSEDGVIVVCRELPESERYMSPLPKPVESDRRMIPGLTDPPCWIVPRGGMCVRFGSVPEYPPMVDFSQFPEDLTDEEAAAVSEIAGEEQQPRPLTGERIPIDLTEGG